MHHMFTHVHTCSQCCISAKSSTPVSCGIRSRVLLLFHFLNTIKCPLFMNASSFVVFFFSVGTIIKTFQVLENGSQNHLCRQGNEINQEYPVMNTSLAVVAGTMSGIMTTLQSMFGINRNIYEKLLDMKKTFTELLVLLQYTYVT